MRHAFFLAAAMAWGCGSAVTIFPNGDGDDASVGVGVGGDGGAASVVGVGGMPDPVGVGAGASGGAGPDTCNGGLSDAVVFGSQGDDVVRGMQIHSDGSIIIGGVYDGTMVLDGAQIATSTGPTPYVAALEADGSLRWFVSFVAQGRVEELAITPGGHIIATGSVFGPTASFGGAPLQVNGQDAFVVRLTQDGAHVWSRTIGGPGNDTARTVAIGDSGNLYVGGYFDGTDEDAYIEKLAGLDGQTIWRREYGGADFQAIRSLATDPNTDHVVITGYTAGPIVIAPFQLGGSDPNPLWHDAFVAKLDSNTGDTVWAIDFVGPYFQRAFSVAIDQGGFIVTTGTFSDTVDFGGITLQSEGQTDMYFVRLDPNGNATWATSFGDGAIQSARQVAIGPNESMLIAGPGSGDMDVGCGRFGSFTGSPQGFASLHDVTGERLFTAKFEDFVESQAHHQYGERALIHPNGRLVVLGHYHGAIGLGGQEFTSMGSADAFLAFYEGVL